MESDMASWEASGELFLLLLLCVHIHFSHRVFSINSIMYRLKIECIFDACLSNLSFFTNYGDLLMTILSPSWWLV